MNERKQTYRINDPLHGEDVRVIVCSNFLCRQVEVDDLPKFKYMTMVLKETLRKYPAAVLFSRAAPRDQTLGGKHIPDDVCALI